MTLRIDNYNYAWQPYFRNFFPVYSITLSCGTARYYFYSTEVSMPIHIYPNTTIALDV